MALHTAQTASFLILYSAVFIMSSSIGGTPLSNNVCGIICNILSHEHYEFAIHTYQYNVTCTMEILLLAICDALD